MIMTSACSCCVGAHQVLTIVVGGGKIGIYFVETNTKRQINAHDDKISILYGTTVHIYSSTL